ncbi:hypothetical protein [Caulobacter phage KcrB]|nr:hypothetical protein RW_GP013c [Caulobacter phage RW]WCA46317.1 hypothetical protein [Caulobacter phage KcrB]WCD56252.1 hypothetical protein [Caulobacter phage RLK]WNV48044.1 hypothetical protein GB2A_gp012c [Caulobacter phage GB2A]
MAKVKSVNAAGKTVETHYPGVLEIRGRFYPRIRIAGKLIYLGSFSDPKEAHEEYVKAKTSARQSTVARLAAARQRKEEEASPKMRAAEAMRALLNNATDRGHLLGMSAVGEAHTPRPRHLEYMGYRIPSKEDQPYALLVPFLQWMLDCATCGQPFDFEIMPQDLNNPPIHCEACVAKAVEPVTAEPSADDLV